MGTNVLSWNQALRMGHQPALYPFIATLAPTGEFEAVLNFKIWAKKTMGICCYFTQAETGRKFQLTVYRRKSDEKYMLDSSEIDFSTCDVARIYRVWVDINGKGKITFKNASYQ
jgi:hypothetical protein